jgi:hypothetical protein
MEVVRGRGGGHGRRRPAGRPEEGAPPHGEDGRRPGRAPGHVRSVPVRGRGPGGGADQRPDAAARRPPAGEGPDHRRARAGGGNGKKRRGPRTTLSVRVGLTARF